MKKRLFQIVSILSFLLLQFACKHPEQVQPCADFPPMYPDYTEITIPYNIAPLNFLLRNKPEATEVEVKGKTTGLTVSGTGKIQFPEKKWQTLLEAEKGNTLTVQVTALVGKEWIRYAPFHWQVAPEKIDSYLSYRLIEPGYEVWNTLQLRERNLENFDERIIADNNLTDGSCMNCHIYGNQDPSLSLFHLRGAQGGTILNRKGKLRKLNTQVDGMISSAVYGSIHPSGRFGVFSTNLIIPEFHAFRSERLEIYDTQSDLVILDFDENEVIPFPSQGAFRTFPVFAADGKSIYYCEAPFRQLPDSIHQLKYSLYRVPFLEATASFGSRIDTLYAAETNGQSVCHPKTSPDGKYLLYTVADYGTFPIWHRETDLQMMHLETGVTDDLRKVNSVCSDTYHSWSSSSRWFVFASKRDDGLYGKPYFSYVDHEGKAHKPFVLPQHDPAKYDYMLKSFNIPELSTGPLPFDALDIEHIYRKEAAEPMRLQK